MKNEEKGKNNGENEGILVSKSQNEGNLAKKQIIWEEQNLCEFPLTALDRETRRKQLIISDTVNLNGQTIKRKWTIDGSLHWGIPIIWDEEIFLVGLSFLDESGEGEFSTFAFCKRAGWQIDGSHYRKFYESALRLALASYIAERSFWDKDKQEYTDKIVFHLFDKMLLYGMKPIGQKETDEHIFDGSKNYWKLSSAILTKNLKPTNLDFYLSLERPVSKRLYRYYDKRLYQEGIIDLDIKRLAEHLGMAEYKYTSQIKRILDPGHQELVKKNYLKSFKYEGDRLFIEAAPRKNLISVPVSLPAGTTSIPPTNARELVKYTGFDITRLAISQAAGLIRDYGCEDARRIVDYALQKINSNGIQARAFGLVMTYEKEAIEHLQKQEQTKKLLKEQEEKEKVEREAAEAEERARKAALAKFAKLPGERQEAIRNQARQNILASGISEKFITPLLLEIEIAKIMPGITGGGSEAERSEATGNSPHSPRGESPAEKFNPDQIEGGSK